MSKDPKSRSKRLASSRGSAGRPPRPQSKKGKGTSRRSRRPAEPPASKAAPKFVQFATLEQELGGEDFALRGWHRMIDLADYIAHLVDGRSTGVLATDAQTYSQVLGLATVLKAAVQWFRLDAGSRPKFIVEAERYLAEQPLGVAIAGTKAVEPNEHPISIRSGPVAARKGGRGVAGRQEAVVRLKDAISQLLSKVSTSELHAHQLAFQDPSAPKPAHGWVLAWGIADALIFEIPVGLLAEELQQ
jgi:hypothetical protein